MAKRCTFTFTRYFTTFIPRESAMKGRESNRASMPTVAAFIDELRALGLEVKVLYAKENGVTLGNKPVYREVFEIPRQWARRAKESFA
jgi:hypothetical protein